MTTEEFDEVEILDDMVSFLKIKFPKSYTDQEKSVLKQLESLAEERKDLKEVMNKKRDEGKIKPISLLSELSSSEAKEKAIKLVREGALNFTSKTKSLEHFDNDLDVFSNKKNLVKDKISDEKTCNEGKSMYQKSKSISFVAGGVEFNANKSDDLVTALNKRKLGMDKTGSFDKEAKKLRTNDDELSSENEICEEEVKDSPNTKEYRNETSINTSNILRICGYQMSEELVKRLIDPISSFISMELEKGYHNTNVIVKFENAEIAKTVREQLDNQYLEGRVITAYYKQENFPGRRMNRRRRRQDNGWNSSRGNGGNNRNRHFSQSDNLPSHFYNETPSEWSVSASLTEHQNPESVWIGMDERREDQINVIRGDSEKDDGKIIVNPVLCPTLESPDKSTKLTNQRDVMSYSDLENI